MLGVLVDVVLSVLCIEVLALLAFGRRVPGLPGFALLAPNLAAGFFLLVALRLAVHDGPALAILACLALAGIAHVADLVARVRRR